MAHQQYRDTTVIGSASSVPIDRDTIVVSGWHSVRWHITRTETEKSSVLSSVCTAVRKRGSSPDVQGSACSEQVDGDTECDTDVRLAQTVASSIPPLGNKLSTSKQPQSENMDTLKATLRGRRHTCPTRAPLNDRLLLKLKTVSGQADFGTC